MASEPKSETWTSPTRRLGDIATPMYWRTGSGPVRFETDDRRFATWTISTMSQRAGDVAALLDVPLRPVS